MGNLLQPCAFWDELATEHHAWLSAFPLQYLRNWKKLLTGDYEAGLCEAAVRRLLQRHAIVIEPNEDLTGSEQRPDFRCTKAQGTFFVEVACIPIDKVIEETGLPYPSQPGARNYRHLNDAIFKTCKGKAPQCGTVIEPTLVAVGTFHADASALCFQRKFGNMLLTGETSLSWLVDTRTGSGVGDTFQTTGLFSAPFLRPQQPAPLQIGEARTSISAVLLCGLAFDPPRTLGILHPCAARPFDCRFLPDIDFGQVEVDRTAGRFCTSWSGGAGE